MDEVIKLVSAKTGLSEEMSRQAVEVVLGYLKDKLPEPVAGQVDALLKGGESGLDLGSLGGGLGALFG